MRSVHLQDVLVAVRAVIAAPAERREALCRDILSRAEVADRRLRGGSGRPSPREDGTLAGAVAGHPRARFLNLDDPDHCACFEMVLRHLRARPRSALL